MLGVVFVIQEHCETYGSNKFYSSQQFRVEEFMHILKVIWS